MPIQFLVVDDYEPFRRFVCSSLRKRQLFRVVAEASDGLEAVHKAAELRPDFIIIDIGLPSLNGIEAARLICRLAPDSKILVLSQESSPDVVKEVLGSGVWGYIIKGHAGTELLAAVDAVIQGRRFVSAALADQLFVGPTDGQAPESIRFDKGFGPLLPGETD